MGVLKLSVAVLICVASYPHHSDGSTEPMKRVLNVGDDLTLECPTDWDPNIILDWLILKTGQTDPKYIVTAGKNYSEGQIHGYFRNDSRISFNYYNMSVSGSTNETKINLELHISNITEQDSARYVCLSSSTVQHKELYFYNIIISCNCSINVNCDLCQQRITTSLNKILTTLRSTSVSQRSSAPSSLFSSMPSNSSTPFSSGITKTVETQTNPTTGIKTQVPTDSTSIVTFSRDASQSRMPVDMTTSTTHAFVSSDSRPTPTLEMSLLSTTAQLQSVPQTLTPAVTKTVHTPTVPVQDGDGSSIPSLTTKPGIMMPSELSTTETERTSTTSQSTTSALISTAGTQIQTTDKESDNVGLDHNAIILISICVLAGIIIIVVIILRRRNCKSSNVRGRNKIRRDRAKYPEAKLKTLSTTIPDFTFQNSGTTVCHLKREESTNDHYYSPILDFNIQQNILTTDNQIGSSQGSRDVVERSDCRVDLSDKRFAETHIYSNEAITMKELKNPNVPDNSDAAHPYFVLENDKTNCFPSQDTYTLPSGRCEASGEVMVDNILYHSSDAFHQGTTAGPSEQRADDTHLYFVLEDDSREPCSSDNP